MISHHWLNSKIKEAMIHCQGSMLKERMENALYSINTQEKIDVLRMFVQYSRLHHVGQPLASLIDVTFEANFS